jgi:cytochrome c oxidase subunit 4
MAANGMRTNYWVWGWLLVLTGIEVFLAYIQLNLVLMLVVLLGLSLVKAALIIGYFMHMKFERLNLILTIIPAGIVCILLFNVFFPDALRLKSHGVNRTLDAPAEHSAPSGH